MGGGKKEWDEEEGKVLRDVFGCGLVSEVCSLCRCCRHGARGKLQRGFERGGGGGGEEDKEVGFASLAGWVCKAEEEGATDTKGDRKFNFDAARDVIARGGGEEKHTFQPFRTSL